MKKEPSYPGLAQQPNSQIGPAAAVHPQLHQFPNFMQFRDMKMTKAPDDSISCSHVFGCFRATAHFPITRSRRYGYSGRVAPNPWPDSSPVRPPAKLFPRPRGSGNVSNRSRKGHTGTLPSERCSSVTAAVACKSSPVSNMIYDRPPMTYTVGYCTGALPGCGCLGNEVSPACQASTR